MTFQEKDLKRILIIFLIFLLGVLAFLVIRPVVFSIVGGLILAYIFFPVYKKITKYVKYKSLAAALVSILVLAIIFIPLWFFAPMMVKQVFALFQYSQNVDVGGIVRTILPTASEETIAQLISTVNNATSKIISTILNWLADFFINFGVISLHLLLVAFVFFFTLRDEAKLREFAAGLLPLNKIQEKVLIKQFKDITQSILYGQIVIGIVQGILTGVGLLLFGVPHALVLTVLAIILAIIPIIGPPIVYLPVTLYLLLVGNPILAIGYLLYNLLIVSGLETILRAHLVSRKTKMSQVIVIIGMIGGIFVFGVLGLILGPLILAYLLTLLRAYKERTLSSFFSS